MVASPAVQVQFAVDDVDVGARIATVLLEERLVACIQQLGPVTSRYRWRGALKKAQEWLFLGKTTAARLDAVVARIAALHPYDTLEVIATEVHGGLDRYLTWIETETS